MAFSGWERAVRSVIWCGTQHRRFRQSSLACLYDHTTSLALPWPNRQQVSANLRQWFESSLDEKHTLPDFLALGAGQAVFVSCMLGVFHQLHPWSVLACFRNVVANGAFSPTKAQQCGLATVYVDGVVVLHILFCRLHAATVGSADVMHG